MKEINFRTQDWQDAQTVFDFFCQETDCLDRAGRLIVEPCYVVAIGDDPLSAYYAATIAKQARRQFGKFPKILCVGGYGWLSKHLNRLGDGTQISEGTKLRMTALRLGNFPATVLDRSNNLGAGIEEIINYMAWNNKAGYPIIFCVIQRLSKRLERTVAFSTVQFPNTQPLNAYYYVPGEDIKEVCQLYNGMALADGLPLLTEAAAVYDRVGTGRYTNRYMAELDKMVPKYVIQAGMHLMERYPLRIHSPLVAPRQYLKMYFGFRNHRKEVETAFEQKVFDWIARI